MHNYSIRNRILAITQAEQREHKEFVGVLNSFLNWKKQDIQILKGSKSYKVLVPIFTKKDDEKTSTQEEEKQEKTLSYFKLGSVFDISQTTEHQNYIKKRAEIDKKIMKNSEIGYDVALEFIKQNVPKVPILEDFKYQDMKGSYHPITHQITLYERSSH